MTRWVAAAAVVVLGALLFALTSPMDVPSETTFPEAISIPTSPTTLLLPDSTPPAIRADSPARLSAALPDGTTFLVSKDPARREEVTDISAGIMVELEEGPKDAGVVVFYLNESESEYSYDDGVYRIPAAGRLITITFYPEVLEALGPDAEATIRRSIKGTTAADDPALVLEPPFRWATDVELPLAMEVAFETFAVRRGCDEIAVACSAQGAVQVIPLDRLRSSAPPWDGTYVSVESQASRPEWHPSYLDRGPLGARVLPDVLWTGSEMIIWGGFSDPRSGRGLVNGAAYNPATDQWRMLAPAPLPEGADSQAVWADGEMIVVSSEATLAYDPEADTWSEIAPGRSTSVFSGQVAWAGGAVYLVDFTKLNRIDRGSAEWTVLPELPFEAGVLPVRLQAFGDELLVVGSFGACEKGVDLALWDGEEWQLLPPIPDLAGPLSATCVDPRQVAVVGDSILVWYEGFDAVTLRPGGSGWTDAGKPTLEGPTGNPSGAVVMGDRVLIPEYGHGTLYDPAAGVWTRVLLPGWGTDWQMVWTGEEVLMWGVTQLSPESGFPLDAWRWTPPES